MKPIIRLTAGLFMASLVSLALAEPNPDLLVGSWNCAYTETTEGVVVDMQLKVDYQADRSARYDMSMNMAMPSMEPMNLGVTGVGNWSLQGDQLTTTTTSVNAVNRGAPNPMVDMLIPQMETGLMQDSVSVSTIVELTRNRLVERTNDATATTITCTR
jgi:hypothetical protein